MRSRGSFSVAGWGTVKAIWEQEFLLLLQLRPESEPPTAAELAALRQSALGRELEAQVTAFLAGRLHCLDLPHVLPSTPDFRSQLWRAAQQIPYGQVLSYGDLASRAGRPRAARAAGSAMSHNPLFLLVPCHRVIASGRRLGGYGGHPDLKRRLLAVEGLTVNDEDRVILP